MNNWNNLQNLLKERGSKRKLSEKTGISTGNISDWFNPNKKAQPNTDALIKLANYFDCSVDFLLDRTDIKEINKQSDELIHSINMNKVIYIDTYLQPVSAGNGNIYIDGIMAPCLYPATPISSKADYCVKISGNSMYPYYLNEDIVYVAKEIPKHNDIGIFIYNNEAFCKKLFDSDGIKKLISLNPNQERYKPIIIKTDSFYAQGKVIGRFHSD